MSIAQKGYIPTADSIAEDAIIELGEAQEFLWEVWEQYFSGISEPAGWSTNYQKIQRTITVYKFLMDRIVDDLLAAYSMGRDYRMKQLKVLVENN